MEARRISRSQLKAWAIGHLKTKQGGNCPLCHKPIDLTVKGHNSAFVVDHCHITGRIRGVLHRGCNGTEGKVFNAVGRWTGLGMDYDKVIPWLEELIKYLKQEPLPLIYPDHKTTEEKELAAKQKAKRAAALRNARLKLRKDGK